MRHHATIYQPVNVRQPGGITQATWTLVDTTKCDARVAGSVSDRIQGGEIQAPARYVVSFPLGTTLQPNYRVVIDGYDDDGRARTITAELIGDVDGQTGRTVRQVIAQAIEEWRTEP